MSAGRSRGKNNVTKRRSMAWRKVEAAGKYSICRSVSIRNSAEVSGERSGIMSWNQGLRDTRTRLHCKYVARVDEGQDNKNGP